MMMAAARFWREIRAFGQKGKRMILALLLMLLMILALLLMLLWLTLLGPAWAASRKGSGEGASDAGW